MFSSVYEAVLGPDNVGKSGFGRLTRLQWGMIAALVVLGIIVLIAIILIIVLYVDHHHTTTVAPS